MDELGAIGDRDLGTSNERRENSDDGLDVLTRSIDRRIEAALRDMPIILEIPTPSEKYIFQRSCQNIGVPVPRPTQRHSLSLQ